MDKRIWQWRWCPSSYRQRNGFRVPRAGSGYSRGTSFSLPRGFPMFAVNSNVWRVRDVDEMWRFVYLDDVGWSETRWYGRSWLDLLNRLFSYTYSEEKLVKRVKLGFQKSSARITHKKRKAKLKNDPFGRDSRLGSSMFLKFQPSIFKKSEW